MIIFALSACGGTTTQAQKVNVSALNIANLPPDKSFEIDLTKNGSLYVFNDKDIDFSRVTIRTDASVVNFADMLKTADINLTTGFILGTPDDMRDYYSGLKDGSNGNVSEYKCGSFACKCDDTGDCMKMMVENNCSVVEATDDGGGFCILAP